MDFISTVYQPHFKMRFLFSFWLIVSFSWVQAQTAEERAKIIKEYQTKNPQSQNMLKAAESAQKKAYEATERRVADYLKKNPDKKRTFVKNGSVYYLKDIDAKGNPIYINTKNKESGKLIKADQLYMGGTLGVNITGQNMVAGVWDGGQVRSTHELLAGKVAMQAGQSLDGTAENYKGNNHMTHVSGTIVGKDIANQPSARGIAHGATALNYDWTEDVAEMNTFASNGYLISNHSYGPANDNTTPLWMFGAYNITAHSYDSVAYKYSYFLPFVAAGNEQSSNGNMSKAGYDLMTAGAAAKNVMTVGALNGDKTMSDYSNWGPTDDGRLKPEIVTKGTGINSSYFADKTTNMPSDVAYSDTINSQGTSYASPAAAAGALLLQQYYKSLHGNYMKAATLKALMLGTAEDLGQPGPDNKFGWGLLDVEKAAQAIKTKSTGGNSTAQNHSDVSTTKGSYIEEITYNLPPYIETDPNRKELSRTVKAKGGEPLIISIAWTDEKGTEQTESNGIDPTTSRLVHEFDMSATTNSPFQESRPWKPSTMANRTANATTQTTWFDGNGNNYKQIKILNPVAGAEYNIFVRKSATSPSTLMPLSLVVTGTAIGGGVSAPTASAQAFCGTKTVGDLVANGTAIKWYDVASEGIALNPTTVLATGTYYASQTVGGVESSRTSVSVTVNALPSAPTGSAIQNLNSSATVANLIATGTNIKWYLTSTGGSALATTTQLVNATIYYASQTVNTCESPRLAVTVNFTSITPAPTASAQAFCGTKTVGDLVANGTAIKWYDVASEGIALNPTTVLATGTYYASQTVGGVESSRTSVSVTVNALPTAPMVSSPVNYTQNQAAIPLSATGSNLLWYTVASGGTGVSLAPTPSTSAIGSSFFYVSQTVNNCESNRSNIQVNVNSATANTVCPAIKVYLEGNWNGTEMTTKLNQQGLLPGQTPLTTIIPSNATPAGHPYKVAPWYFAGTETVSSYDTDVVDWVIMTLRTNPSDTTTNVFKTAALLRKNGTISLQVGCPTLNPAQSYYVTVEHRNHIGAISHQAVSINNNQLTYDFTQQESYLPPNVPSSGQVKIGTVYCLMGGDAAKTPFSEINVNDNSIWRTDNGIFARYKATDYNLDGEINAIDDIIWRRNNGKFSSIKR
jgi:serine protease AprX